jgi:hypothetical protein
MTQGRAWLGRLVAAAFVLAAGRTALGHGSLDSNVSGTLRPTGLDLQLYLSRYSAALLIEQPGAPLTITRATFPAVEARLAAAAPSFVAVTAGGGGDAPGGTLAADASAVTLTDEDDVCLRLHYPAPAGGRLGVRGGYLKKMDDGHVGMVALLDAQGNVLGQGEIAADAPEFDVFLPAAQAATRPVAAAPPVPIPPRQESAVHGGRRGMWWIAMAGGLAVLLAAVWAALSRRRTDS